MSATTATVTTASITPELFAEPNVRAMRRAVVIAALGAVLVVGFGLRAYRLGVESLSEDELNKVRAVEQYRAEGLTSANGEHPFVMKALLTLSTLAADRWNATQTAQANADMRVSTETATRLPGALLGALTSVLIFLVMAELFGTEIGFIAAALWAFDPSAIGFNRIAKEDTFFIFFFLLANVFWLRGQRIAEAGRRDPARFYWATAAAFGAMVASKYLPYFICISISYYYIFQGVGATRWRMGKRRWLIFFGVMGATFLLCNPTILLPGTWREMGIFAGERRIGHDSYEFIGALYGNKVTLWLTGVPWYFYFVFMGVKLPVTTVLMFVVGVPVLFLKRLGDGRFFILFWLFFFFLPFTVMGGKFTRYFTLALPVVVMTAALGIHATTKYLTGGLSRLAARDFSRGAVQTCVAGVVLAFALYASATVAPHYRLYTNALGGGMVRAGSYFPHDEFYDASTRATVEAIAARAQPGARVASETPELFTYYARLAGRDDLLSVSLSDHVAMRQFSAGDVVVVARGRRYFSNDAIINKLRETSAPAVNISLGKTPSASVFILDRAASEAVSGVLNPQPARRVATNAISRASQVPMRNAPDNEYSSRPSRTRDAVVSLFPARALQMMILRKH